MIELWIDEQRCDIDHVPVIPIDFDATHLTKVEGERSGRIVELVLPATPANDALFGTSRDIYAQKRFNMEHHVARIEKDGVSIFGGTVYLLNTTITEGMNGCYSIRINEGGAEWIDGVVYGSLADLDIPFAESLNMMTIANSWEGDSAVRFLPVYRGNYLPHYSSSSAIPVERVLLTDDYHPFISIADMVRAMFAKSGYIVRSNFFESELGRSLYMSGEYARTNNASAKAKCDFLARRAEEGTTTADFAGMVYTSTSVAAHSLGPIVDTANPEAIDASGVAMSDTFCINESFSKNSAGNICFTPKVAVNAGFILHLEYSSEYEILSRERLCGFDVVEGLDGERVEVALANNCHDFRGETSTNMKYRAIVFDHVENRQYQLSANLVDNSIVGIKSWSTRSMLVTTPSTQIKTMTLYYRDSEQESWRRYTGDWALYAGYIDERGMVDVEMDIRLAPQEIAAGEKFLLDKFRFGGAKAGMKLIVGTGTSLRPYFTSVPGYGSMLEFKDIAPRNIRQVDLLSALGDMFNLAFYTDRNLKEIYIEPLESIYQDAEVVDWSKRIDLLNGVSVSDAGLDLPQDVVLAYIDADKASQDFNKANNTTLGRWSFRNPLYGTKRSTHRVGGGLFTTTLNTSNILANAPSASVMQVGDVGGESGEAYNTFTPRIVCYKGLRDLPNGESWGSSDISGKYPYAAFLDEESINLCFENRNGIEGLHRYHQPMLLRQRDSRKVTLDLFLTTAETANLFTVDGTKPSVRTRFRFDIQGESALFRLVKVEQWDLESNIVRCSFEQE